MDKVVPETTLSVDALVVGAGFGGIHALHKLRNEFGMSAEAIDRAAGVGGTWYWNKYPGALSDSEAFVYQYSFDKDLYQDNPLRSKYVKQPDILKYLNGVVDRFGLREHIRLETGMTGAEFNEAKSIWSIRTDAGITYEAQYLITALGLLSATNIPDFQGVERFQGRIVHTGNWPDDLDLTGKRVGVIGNGSTGNQVITSTAPIVKHLTAFIRTPQYSVPAGNRSLTEAEERSYKENFEKTWEQVRGSSVAFGFAESTTPAMSVSSEERERIFEAAWNEGGGFRFMFETFSDLATDPVANEEAAKFIRRKIAQIVKDPDTAKALTPTDLYARRPQCDSGFYEAFNRENVSVALVKDNPIAHLNENGIVLADGTEYELDVIVMATGFDAVDGNYVKVDITGRDGVALKDHWSEGPTSYMGISTAGFPNMFMVLGPNSPFTNLVPSIEAQVEAIGLAIKHLRSNETAWMDVQPEAETRWTELCTDIANATLFPKADSWIFGANIPGKKHTVLFYLGGLKAFRDLVITESAGGFPNFVTSQEILVNA
ncbi:flavin-containing monooxygenase [Glutamicibacter sp. NPDC127525]|uniref:flavin-containing monooxygenase n=1 Tax=unclassified Glutamicibacter TaxID=2627139 RepID=UPI0036449EAF